MGAFDHLNWAYDKAFEQVFGLGRWGEAFEQKIFQKFKRLGGGGGKLKLQFDWYIMSIWQMGHAAEPIMFIEDIVGHLKY